MPRRVCGTMGDVDGQGESPNRRLSQIETVWSVVRQATSDRPADRRNAQDALIAIYEASIRSYLIACLNDPHAADEVFQDFGLKLSRGDFASADPSRGRFRSFVKSVLYRLVIDYHRSHMKMAARRLHHNDMFEPAVHEEPVIDDDERFERSWKEGLLQYAWAQLREEQEDHGHHYYTMLKLRAEHSDWSSSQLIDAMKTKSGRQFSSSAVRVALHRARKRFAEFLLDAVAASMPNDSRAELENELISLDLMRYCGDIFRERR